MGPVFFRGTKVLMGPQFYCTQYTHTHTHSTGPNAAAELLLGAQAHRIKLSLQHVIILLYLHELIACLVILHCQNRRQS